MITELERAGQLDRALEALPTDEELAARRPAGGGLTSPELAVLLAYVEDHRRPATINDVHAARRRVDPTGPGRLLPHAAARAVRRPDGRRTALHREIVTTQLVNEAVNRGGPRSCSGPMEETGASAGRRASGPTWSCATCSACPALWRAIESAGRRASHGRAQTALYLEIRRLIDRAVRWLLSTRRARRWT